MTNLVLKMPTSNKIYFIATLTNILSDTVFRQKKYSETVQSVEGGYDEKNSMAAYVVHVDVLSRLAISRQRKITASL